MGLRKKSIVLNEMVLGTNWAPVRSATSIYSIVSRALILEIRAGHYPVGEKLPTEPELQKRFGVSRHTVREALRELKAQGLIVSHPGIGTIVRRADASSQFMQAAGDLRELIQFKDATMMRLLGRREFVADEAWADWLAAEPNQKWIEASVLRIIPNEAKPASWTLLYVRAEHEDVIDVVEKEGPPVYGLLERMHGFKIVEVTQQIVAVTLDKRAAELLNAPQGSPALQLKRRFIDSHAGVVLVSAGQYPSDRFSHNTKFVVHKR